MIARHFFLFAKFHQPYIFLRFFCVTRIDIQIERFFLVLFSRLHFMKKKKTESLGKHLIFHILRPFLFSLQRFRWMQRIPMNDFYALIQRYWSISINGEGFLTFCFPLTFPLFKTFIWYSWKYLVCKKLLLINYFHPLDFIRKQF